MKIEKEPSERLIDQRHRNRIMEILEYLADGDTSVRSMGASGYFNWYYDFTRHSKEGGLYPNSTINADEQHMLQQVGKIVDEALDSTPRLATEEALITSGWPAKIRPVAQKAMAVMLKRGRFREDQEEDEPCPEE